jgi:hypothetical protein
MIQTLFLASTLVITGGFRNPGGGGPGPISANADLLYAPRVGVSNKAEVLQMWGRPASERVEKDHAICTWPRGKVTVILTFNTKLDVLVDRKVVKQ